MQVNTRAVTRPVMRYHGGKFILAPWIISHFPAHRVYVEPFCGAASVLMRKPRAYAEVIGDLDGEVVNVFRVLRNPSQARELQRLLHLTPFAREEFMGAYLSAGDPIEQARRTIFKSFAGFGSAAVTAYGEVLNSDTFRAPTGFRGNVTREGTTPAHDWRGYPDLLPAFVERLRGVVIENRPAEAVMRQHDSTVTLHYVDPPYPKGSRSDHGDDYRHEMTDDDHRALAEMLHGLSGMVVLSGYPCALYDDELFPTWRRVEREALAGGAAKRTEVLWLNPAAAAAIPSQARLL